MKFTHLPTRKLPKLEQVNKDGNRHYLRKGKKYPSVTRVVGMLDREGIQRWKDYLINKHGKVAGEAEATRVSENSMKVGTELHLMIEDYLNNKTPVETKSDYEFSPTTLLENLTPLLNNINNISAQEVRLFSDELELAGTADCIAEYDGVPSIIDFKNARKKKQKAWITKYFVQTACYSLMWEELTGQMIKQLVIIVGGWDGSTTTYIENRDNFIEKIWEASIKYLKEQ